MRPTELGGEVARKRAGPFAGVRVGEARHPGPSAPSPPDDTARAELEREANAQAAHQRERAWNALQLQGMISGGAAPTEPGETTPEVTTPACTPRGPQHDGETQLLMRLSWQGQGPPTVPARGSRPTLSQYFVPLLLHAAGMLEDPAARAWEDVPWFRAGRAALAQPPPVSVARLLSAIDQQARAGAAPTPDANLRSLRGVAPAAGGVMLPVAVAALVQENHYLTASSQEALLIFYAGEAAASRISAGAAALTAPPIPVADNATPAGHSVDGQVAQVAGMAARARGRGRRGRGGRGRGRRGVQSLRPPAATQLDTDSDQDACGGTAPSQRGQARTSPAALPAMLPHLRSIDLAAELGNRVYTFQSPPRQLRGLLRNAMRVALEAILDGAGTDTELDGWKLFVLAPRMLLFRAPGAARVPLAELARRERLFCEGKWVQLLVESAAAARESTEASAAPGRGRPADGSADDVRRRADRAAALAHMGELSAAAQALTASPLAPATSATLAALRDPERRPPTVQVPLDPPLDPRSSPVVELCTRRLLANLRRARRGAAAGPSGCTNEHLRVLLDEESCTQLLGRVAGRLASLKCRERSRGR